MPVIVQAGNTRTVVVDDARTANVTMNRPATVSVNDRRTATALQQRTSVVEVASPGPQGPKGDPGIGGGSTGLDRVAPAHALGGHRVVRSVGASVVDYADCTSAGHGDDTLGMTIAAAEPGAPVQVLTAGPLTFNGWAWAQGPIYLGSNGLLTQTPPDPDAGALFLQVIGFAETATTIQIGPEPPVYF